MGASVPTPVLLRANGRSWPLNHEDPFLLRSLSSPRFRSGGWFGEGPRPSGTAPRGRPRPCGRYFSPALRSQDGSESFVHGAVRLEGLRHVRVQMRQVGAATEGLRVLAPDAPGHSTEVVLRSLLIPVKSHLIKVPRRKIRRQKTKDSEERVGLHPCATLSSSNPSKGQEARSSWIGISRCSAVTARWTSRRSRRSPPGSPRRGSTPGWTSERSSRGTTSSPRSTRGSRSTTWASSSSPRPPWNPAGSPPR
jgi:hypothetical protein